MARPHILLFLRALLFLFILASARSQSGIQSKEICHGGICIEQRTTKLYLTFSVNGGKSYRGNVFRKGFRKEVSGSSSIVPNIEPYLTYTLNLFVTYNNNSEKSFSRRFTTCGEPTIQEVTAASKWTVVCNDNNICSLKINFQPPREGSEFCQIYQTVLLIRRQSTSFAGTIIRFNGEPYYDRRLNDFDVTSYSYTMTNKAGYGSRSSLIRLQENDYQRCAADTCESGVACRTDLQDVLRYCGDKPTTTTTTVATTLPAATETRTPGVEPTSTKGSATAQTAQRTNRRTESTERRDETTMQPQSNEYTPTGLSGPPLYIVISIVGVVLAIMLCLLIWLLITRLRKDKNKQKRHYRRHDEDEDLENEGAHGGGANGVVVGAKRKKSKKSRKGKGKLGNKPKRSKRETSDDEDPRPNGEENRSRRNDSPHDSLNYSAQYNNSSTRRQDSTYDTNFPGRTEAPPLNLVRNNPRRPPPPSRNYRGSQSSTLDDNDDFYSAGGLPPRYSNSPPPAGQFDADVFQYNG